VLWFNREFVMWAASNVIFDETASNEFSTDNDVCWVYHYQGSAVREKVVPWISGRLAAEWDFVVMCTDYNSMILGHYK
jgi:hypothetical protein